MEKWSTGALVAVGMGTLLIGIVVGGRVMANYCVQVCPELLNRKPVSRNQRLRGARRPAAAAADRFQHDYETLARYRL